MPHTIQRSWRRAVTDRTRRERADHDRETRDQTDREVDQRGVLNQLRDANEHVAVPRRVDDARDRCTAKEQRREIDRGKERAPGVASHPRIGPIRKDQRKVQEERREQELRRQVAPVEHPVEGIEPAGEREREHAEERDGQPEEMQRRLVIGAAEPHGRADQQREDADRGEHEVEPARTRGDRLDRNVDHLLRAQPQDGVVQRGALLAGVEHLDHVLRARDGPAVDREENISYLESGARRPGAGRHFHGRDVVAAGAPEHAVLDLVPPNPLGDVGDRETEEEKDEPYLARRSHPHVPQS